MFKPNFKNSILNVSATLDKFLGNKNNAVSIKELEYILNKGYKNVIYICFDGMGIYPLKQNLKGNSFLRKHVLKKITSVFPSTTTNATTTLYTAKYPSQHGLLGWSLYFEKIDKCVDIYLGKDSYSTEKISSKVVDDYMKFDYFFDKNNSEYNLTTIFPPYVKREKNNISYETIDELFVNIEKICKSNYKNFIFAYCGEPDATMHKFGVTSCEAKKKIIEINKYVEELANKLTNSVIVITPDHGQTDIKEYINLYEDKELVDSLKTPFYIEPRAVGFQVKNEEKFLKAIKKYRKDAKLYKVNKLIRNDYFGPYTERLRMLGDYMLIMKNNYKQFVFSEDSTRFAGHHTALTKREMILPLIVIEK